MFWYGVGLGVVWSWFRGGMQLSPLDSALTVWGGGLFY